VVLVAEAGKLLEGRYRLIAPLGRGGMGTVWRAEHTKLGTRVAIKLMTSTVAASVEAIARFRREAQVAAGLESPNVVRILDFGVEGDTPYIAMELLEGETLAARIVHEPIAPERLLPIATQMARGIACAHQARVVHCDLKPENVFLARIDGEETVKLLDFGVAKAPLLDPLTQTGQVLGTLQYMSPEQLQGRRHVDARSDLYSFAVIVFECLCGKPAFPGQSIGELVRAICDAPLPVPSAVASVPAGFDAWFARAAHRAPESRFAGAKEMIESLAAALASSAPPRAATWSARPATSRTLHTTDAASHRGGTEGAGFRVAPNTRTRVLEIELWGMHDVAIASAARAALVDAIEQMSHGGTWVAIAFGGRHPPQSAEVQAIEAASMSAAAPAGMRRVAFVIESALGARSVQRLATENAMPNARVFSDEAEARAWIAEALAATGPRRGGDDRAGFRIAPDMRTRVVEIERWGLWTVPLAAEFKRELLEVCEQMKGAPWAGLSFASRHPPQSPEVQQYQSDTMAVAKSFGLVRAAMVADSALSAMMVRRLTQQSQMDVARVFTSEREARAWLAELRLGD
jgi:serine/threonine-protein kinase